MAFRSLFFVFFSASLLSVATSQSLLDILGIGGGSGGGGGSGSTSGTSTGTGTGSGTGTNPGVVTGTVEISGSLGGGSGGGQTGVGGPTIQRLPNNMPSSTQTQNGMQLPVQPYCSAAEVRTLFNNCAMSFGVAHRRHFSYLASQPTCVAERFDCGMVDSFVRCVNSQPINVISNRCWVMVRDVLTSFLRRYNLPCTFDDIYQQCERVSQDILPLEQRPQAGMGMDTNPMSYIMPIIRQFIPVITLLFSGGGGLGAMLGL